MAQAAAQSSPSSASKTERVVRAIRSQITAGRLAPGEQLPTWSAMQRKYGVGRVTLMRAMSQLRRDGFVYASSTRGTFVSPTPPHLHRYGLVFQRRPGEAGWNRFWWTLANLASQISADGKRCIELFCGVTGHADQPEYQRLMAAVEAECLAGVVCVGPLEMMCPGLLHRRDVPKVAIASELSRETQPHVYVDGESFVRRSAEELARRGRRRVAVLMLPDGLFNGFESAFVRSGLETRPHWQLPVHPDSVFAVTRLLLDAANHDRPDALIIADDNLVERASAAIIDAGLRVPEDLELITHCNWPAPVQSVLPARRVGFDARAVLEAGLASIDAQRRGKKPRPWTGVPAIFEEELRKGEAPAEPRSAGRT